MNRNNVNENVTIFLAQVRFAVRRFRCAPPPMSTRKDTTIYTDASAKVTFTQKWTPAGTRLYYATFAGDTWYTASTSVVVTIIVR